MCELHWSGLDVRFLAKLVGFEAHLMLAGLKFRGVCGFRSFPVQARIYAQGRTMPGKIVTDAKPGRSYHNFGLAADYVRLPQATMSDVEAWEKFGAIVRSCGLVWGGDFKTLRDLGHVQMPGKLPKAKK